MKKRLLLVIPFIFLFLMPVVMGLSIDKQDYYINVYPNQLVCMERQIKIEDNTYLLFSSDKDIQIESVKAIGNEKDLKINSLVKDDLEILAGKEESYNQLAYITKNSTIRTCYQMPDFEALQNLKSGKFSYCAFENTAVAGNYVQDCENSVWWNFNYNNRQEITFLASESYNNVSKCLQIDYNSLMELNFQDITFTKQNDSENFSESEEVWYLDNKIDGIEATYCVNVDIDILQNVSGIANQTHYFYYDYDYADNSNKSCFGCINWTIITCEDNPYALWRFNEGIGDIVNESCEGILNGTIINGTWTEGRLGNALYLNGSEDDSHVDFGDILGFDSDENFSIIAWGRTNESNGCFFGKHDGERGLGLCFLSDLLVAGLGSNITEENRMWRMSSSTASHDGEFHSVAWTYDGSSNVSGFHFYFDGVLDDGLSFNNLTGSILTNEPVTLGKVIPYGQWFIGSIDELVIFNRTLTSLEIQNFYDKTTNIDTNISEPQPKPVDLDCQYTDEPFLDKRIKWLCTIPNNETYHCYSYSYDTNLTLIQANPKPINIDDIGKISYFKSFGNLSQIINIEFDTADMPADTDVTMRVRCRSTTSDRDLIFSKITTPRYRELTQGVDFWIHIARTPVYYVGLIIIGFILIGLLLWFIKLLRNK